MNDTITYDIRKPLNDNLRAAGVEPAEFMEEYNKWCSSIILIEMGVKVPLVGGTKMGIVTLGLGVIAAGVYAAWFLQTAPAATLQLLTNVVADVCVAKAGWVAPVAVDALQCAVANQAVQAAMGQAINNAVIIAGPVCAAGVGLVVKGLEDEKVTFNSEELTKKVVESVEQYTKNQAAATRATTLSLLQAQTMRNQKQLDNADLLLQVAKVGATTVAAGAAGGVVGAGTAAGVGFGNIIQREGLKLKTRGNRVLEILNQQRQQQQLNQQRQQGGARNSAKITEAALLMSGVSLDIAKNVANSIKTQNGSSRTRKNYRKN